MAIRIRASLLGGKSSPTKEEVRTLLKLPFVLEAARISALSLTKIAANNMVNAQNHNSPTYVPRIIAREFVHNVLSLYEGKPADSKLYPDTLPGLARFWSFTITNLGLNGGSLVGPLERDLLYRDTTLSTFFWTSALGMAQGRTDKEMTTQRYIAPVHEALRSGKYNPFILESM